MMRNKWFMLICAAGLLTVSLEAKPKPKHDREAREERRREQWSQGRRPGQLPPGLERQQRERGQLPPGLERQRRETGHLPPGLEKRSAPVGRGRR